VYVGLQSGSYRNLALLAESMQKAAAFRQYVSQTFLRECIFKWIQARYCGGAVGGMVESVVTAAQESVRPWEIWVPITDVYVESRWELGNVVLTPIDRSIFDNMLARAREQQAEVPADFVAFVESTRKSLQGLAAAVSQITAEPRRAEERALQETELALSVLRIYCKAQLVPQFVCRWAPFGVVPQRTRTVMFMGKNGIERHNSRMIDKPAWGVFATTEVEELREFGLSAYSELLKAPTRTDFQEKVLQSVVRYSKAPLEPDVEDRLVHYFSALESLLLRHQGEPVLQNISERLAVFVENTLEGRKRILRDTKDVYDMRSARVHGRTIEEGEALQRFMQYLARFYVRVAQHLNAFPSKVAFLDRLDDMKMSGGVG
jgi:hypothetical protein